MLKILYITIKQLLEYKLINIIMVIQIYITLIIANITMSTILQITCITRITNNTDLVHAIYFSAFPRVIDDNMKNPDFINKRLLSLDGVSIGNALYFSAQFPNCNEPVRVSMYNSVLVNSINLPLKSGSWFTVEHTSSDIRPIIISNALSKHYKLGDIINIREIRPDSNKTPVRVVGILDNGDYSLRLGAGGDFLSLSAIFERNDHFAIMSIEDNCFKPYDEFGRLLFLSNKDTFNKIDSQLNDIGHVYKISDMEEQYKKSINEKLILQFIIFLILFILACTGIGGNNALMLNSKEKEYAIDFICGMAWIKCVIVSLVSNIVILLIPSTAAYLTLTMPANFPMFQNLYINGYNLIFSIGLIIIIFIITSVQPLFGLYKTDPIQIIRRFN